MSHFEDVLQAVASYPAAPLVSSLEVELDLATVFQLAWWAASEHQPAVRVQLPTAQSFPFDWSRSMAEGEQHDDEIRIGFSPSGARWDHLNALARVSAMLRELPDGSTLELVVSGDYPLRACGQVGARSWHLSSFYPAVTHDALQRALKLSRESREGNALTASSDQVAEDARESFVAEWALTDESDLKIERQGQILRAVSQDQDNESWSRLLAGHVFLHDSELRAVFGLEAQLEQLRAELEQGDDLMATLNQQIAAGLGQAMGIRQGEVLLAGKKVTFHVSDIRQSKWLPPSEVDTSDDELRELGFSPLGDFTGDGVVMRAYACQPADCVAVVNASYNGQYLREFFSRCRDGSCLTTSSLPFGTEKVSKKLYRQSLPDHDFGQLLQAHRGRVAKEGWEPELCAPELKAVARWMDDYMVLWHQ